MSSSIWVTDFDRQLADDGHGNNFILVACEERGLAHVHSTAHESGYVFYNFKSRRRLRFDDVVQVQPFLTRNLRKGKGVLTSKRNQRRTRTRTPVILDTVGDSRDGKTYIPIITEIGVGDGVSHVTGSLADAASVAHSVHRAERAVLSQKLEERANKTEALVKYQNSVLVKTLHTKLNQAQEVLGSARRSLENQLEDRRRQHTTKVRELEKSHNEKEDHSRSSEKAIEELHTKLLALAEEKEEAIKTHLLAFEEQKRVLEEEVRRTREEFHKALETESAAPDLRDVTVQEAALRDRLNKLNDTHQNKIRELEARYKEALVQKESRIGELEGAVEELEGSATQVDMLRERIHELNVEVEELKEAKDTNEGVIQDYRDTIGQLKERLGEEEEVQRQYDELEDERDQALSVIETREEEISNLKELLEAKSDQASGLEEEVQTLKEELEGRPTDEEVAKMSKDMAKMSGRLEKYDAAISECFKIRDERDRCANELKDTKHFVDNMKFAQKGLHKVLNQAKNDLDKTKASLNACETEKKEKSEGLSVCEKNLAEVIEERDAAIRTNNPA